MEERGFFRRARDNDDDNDDDDHNVEHQVEVRVGKEAGLPNRGNTCFANASVQFLRAARGADWASARPLSRFVGEGEGEGVDAWLRLAKETRPELVNGGQQDAAEFVQALLDEAAVEKVFQASCAEEESASAVQRESRAKSRFYF